MISADQNAAVCRWLAINSRQPAKAMQAWAEMLATVDREDRIHFERGDLARLIGATPTDVSRIRGELVRIGALIREHRPGHPIRYLVNPRIATHLTGVARDLAQSVAPPLNLANLAEARHRLRKSA